MPVGIMELGFLRDHAKAEIATRANLKASLGERGAIAARATIVEAIGQRIEFACQSAEILRGGFGEERFHRPSEYHIRPPESNRVKYLIYLGVFRIYRN